MDATSAPARCHTPPSQIVHHGGGFKVYTPSPKKGGGSPAGATPPAEPTLSPSKLGIVRSLTLEGEGAVAGAGVGRLDRRLIERFPHVDTTDSLASAAHAAAIHALGRVSPGLEAAIADGLEFKYVVRTTAMPEASDGAGTVTPLASPIPTPSMGACGGAGFRSPETLVKAASEGVVDIKNPYPDVDSLLAAVISHSKASPGRGGLTGRASVVADSSSPDVSAVVGRAFDSLYASKTPTYADAVKTAPNLDPTRARFIGLDEALRAAKGVVMVTGSDGRHENPLGASPQEVVVAFPTRPPSPLTRQMKAIIDTDVLFSGHMDVVCLDAPGETLITRSSGDRKKLIPTVPFDAEFVAGDRDTFEAYGRRAYEAIKATSSFSLFVKEFVKPAIKQLARDFRGDEGKHVDIETGLLDIDHTNYIKASKYGLLRPVQYLLAKIIVDKIKSGEISLVQYNALKGRSTIDRLTLMSEWGLLETKPDAVKNVCWAYSIAMLWLHLAYYNTKTKGSIKVPPDILREVIETIFNFVKAEKLYTTVLDEKSG